MLDEGQGVREGSIPLETYFDTEWATRDLGLGSLTLGG
jgi:hypothetical protein